MENVKMSNDYSESTAIKLIHETYKTQMLLLMNQIKTTDRLKTNKSFVICDIGCADAKISLPLYVLIIEEIRKENTEIPIILYLNDLPQNNWKSCIDNVESSLDFDINVFVYTKPKSFYMKLFPNDSVDLFLCLGMLYYLSCEKPPTTPIDYHIYPLLKTIQNDINSKLWFDQAEKDLDLFFSLRREELKEGGNIITGFFGYSDPPTEDELKQLKYLTETKLLLLDTLEDYRISSIKDKITFCQVYRSFYLYSESISRCSLNMVQSICEKPDFGVCPSTNKQNSVDCAQIATNFLKAWSEKIYYSLINSILNDEDKTREIIESYYTKVNKYFLNNIENYPKNDSRWIIMIRK
jgi:hypothetical protein